MRCPRCQSAVSDLIAFRGQEVCRHCVADSIQWEDDKAWRDSPAGIAYYENEERELKKIRDEINARFVGPCTPGEIDAVEASGKYVTPHQRLRMWEHEHGFHLYRTPEEEGK